MTNRLLATTLVLSSLTLAWGCARDPAKDAPKAGAGDVTATVAATAAPSASAAAPAAGSDMLPIDAAASKLAWTGSKVTKVHPGGFKKFSGNVQLVDSDPEKSKVTIDIDVDSIYTDSEKLIGHLKTPDFFDVKTYPTAKFESTSITKGGAEGATHTVKGNLTMHGVTKEITFPATIKVEGGAVTASAKFSINRQDWGIAYKGAADDLVRDDVLIEWSIVAKKS